MCGDSIERRKQGGVLPALPISERIGGKTRNEQARRKKGTDIDRRCEKPNMANAESDSIRAKL